ncbi:MAG TPA: hypothetical protein VGF20_03550 [Candidatus Acidoferrum sp.]|jgi:hypothetical protein
MVQGIAKTYSLHVRCPYGDHDDWVTLHNRLESLEQICANPCSFECPTHGAQQGFPLEGVEKSSTSIAAQKSSPAFSPPKTKKPLRSSERKPYHAPVVVYGWSKAMGSFHEQTTTLMFNASGALVKLATSVDIGENLFIVNKFTNEELEARVVFKQPHYKGGTEIGLAFAKPNANFWRKTRRGKRAPQTFRVFVRGKDRNGNPFSQSSFTMDISEDGARLDNVAYLTTPGDVIEVKRRWHGKAKFRVAWIGQIGTSESNQIGICTLDSGKLPWRLKFAELPPSKPPKKS